MAPLLSTALYHRNPADARPSAHALLQTHLARLAMRPIGGSRCIACLAGRSIWQFALSQVSVGLDIALIDPASTR
jgi:hypothetical protein